jgi:CRP/FNR family transcriptional regulator, anaerobic regulatory protein
MEMLSKTLQALIGAVVTPNTVEWGQFAAKVKTKIYSRHQLIVVPFKPCNLIFFIEEGYTRHFYINENDEEIVTWLSKPGDVVTELYGFYRNANVKFGVRTLTPTTIHYLHKNDLYALYDESHLWERFGRIVAEHAMIRLSDMALIMQGGDAMDRYKFILDRNPEIFASVSLGQIASFLGITQETLSRVRKRMSK